MCKTVHELILHVVQNLCRELARGAQTVIGPELANITEKKKKQIGTNGNHLLDSGLARWVSYGGLRMIKALGKRSKPHGMESGAVSGSTTCPYTLALWVMEHRWRERQLCECGCVY